MSASLRPLRTVLALFVLCLVAGEARAGTHKDPRVGFELSVPNGWTEIPLQKDEAWVVAKYKSKKDDTWRDSNTGSTYSYHPRLTVIVFLDEIVEGESEVESEGSETKIVWESPFEDYIDYMKTMQSGFFIADEEELEQNGLPVYRYEINWSGGGQATIKIHTWVYTTELGKIAVQMECFEDAYGKHKRTFSKTLKSLKAIERTEDLTLVDNFENRFGSLFSWNLDAEERTLRRKEAEKETWRQVSEDLPDGWKAKVIKDVPVLTTDMGYAKKVVDRINGIRSWLEENFGVIGEGEYARTPLVRVFEDASSEADFLNGLGSMANEIVTNKRGRIDVRPFNSGYSTYFSTELGYVNVQTMLLWLRDRDRDVLNSMPSWLIWGMSQMIAVAEPKGRRMSYPKNDWERMFVRSVDEGDITPVQTLMRMPASEFFDGDTSARLGEAMALCRYLLDGPGAKNKLTRDLIPTYLMHLSEVVKESRKVKFEGGDEEPKNEEEEAALEQRLREFWKERREHVLNETFNRTFADWDDAKWNVLESAYRKAF